MSTVVFIVPSHFIGIDIENSFRENVTHVLINSYVGVIRYYR